MRWNKLLHRLSLSGLGVLNYENPRVSGELYFLHKVALQQKSKSIIFDVGANQGNYSLMCLDIFSNVKIYAFEPHPKTFSVLTGAVSGRCVYCVNKAVGSECKKIDLFDYKESDGSSHASLYKNVIEKIHSAKSVFHQVDVVMIDDFVRENKIQKINLLKIDTEGNELNVLYGARDSIRNGLVDIIHFEYNEMNIVSRTFFKDFYEMLSNYTLWRLLPSGMICLNSNSLTTEIFAYQNIVAISNRLIF